MIQVSEIRTFLIERLHKLGKEKGGREERKEGMEKKPPEFLACLENPRSAGAGQSLSAQPVLSSDRTCSRAAVFPAALDLAGLAQRASLGM